MLYEETRCDRCISRSALGDYSINPYIGCQHQCAYCYVPKITKNPEWKSKVKVKVNLNVTLAKELTNPRIKKGSSFFLSSLTDPYQPIESKYGLTSDALQQLLANGMKVVIQTKSPLVLKDLNLLKYNAKNVQVGFTVLGLDGNVKDALEPNAPSVNSRIKAMAYLADRGIYVFAFLGPVIPAWTDIDLEYLLAELRDIGVKELSVDKLRFRPGLRKELTEIMGNFFHGDLEYESQLAYAKVVKKVREFSGEHGILFTNPFSY